MTLSAIENGDARLTLMYALNAWRNAHVREPNGSVYIEEARRLQRELRLASNEPEGTAIEFTELSVECLTAAAYECSSSTLVDVPRLLEDVRPVITRISEALKQTA